MALRNWFKPCHNLVAWLRRNLILNSYGLAATCLGALVCLAKQELGSILCRKKTIKISDVIIFMWYNYFEKIERSKI